jgi:soluble epoxide hydrolase / lipid-phosphate phosphatase
VIYPEDPKSWITHFGPSGMLRKHLLSGETLPTPSWFAPGVRRLSWHNACYRSFPGERIPVQHSEDFRPLWSFHLLSGILGKRPVFRRRVYVPEALRMPDSLLTLNPWTAVPRHSYSMTKPIFFGGGTEDYISLPSIGKQTTALFCDSSKITIRDFKATHWMHLQVPDEVNKELLQWMQCL